MKQLFTTVLMLLALSTSVVNAQQSRTYTSDEVSTLLTDLIAAVDGDEFVLTTPGDQGFYKIDSTALEIHNDVTIRSENGLMTRPMIKLVYNQKYKDAADTSMVDYLIRFKADTSELTLYGLELQGDTANTKYCIRTAKLADYTGSDSYKDPLWQEDSVVQRYVINMDNCDMNGIKSGSDGRGFMLYVGTRGSIDVKNCTFSSMERDVFNMYSDGDRTTANGPFQYVDSIKIMNSTFFNIGREAITYRNSGETIDDLNVSKNSKIYVENCVFDSVGQGSTTDSYYCFRTDPAELHVKNCIFSNMTTEDYILRNNNAASTISDVALINVNKVIVDAAAAWDDIEDAIDFEDDSRDETNITMNTLDPMYADRYAGDFTYGATATTLAAGSDGVDLGDLRWSPGFVPANCASLSDLAVNGTSVDNFDGATLSYTVNLPAGTTTTVTTATAMNTEAVVEITDATTIPGVAIVKVTSMDGWEMKTYEVVLLTAMNDDATLSDLTMDGTTVANFDAATTTYDVELPVGTTAVPTVVGTATDANATVAVTDAADLPGATTVLVTAEDQSTTATYTINFTVAVSVENETFGRLLIYPNPASDIVNVANCEGASLRIFSMSGVEVLNRTNIASIERFSTNFAQGIYTIQIELDGSRISKKLVVK